MISKLFHQISAERLDISSEAFESTLAQQLKAYFFSKKYIKDKTVIELGCGTGYGTSLLAKLAKKIIAIDNDAYTIEENKRQNRERNITFFHKSIEDFSSHEKVDVVLSFQVIEHMKDVDDFFSTVARVLKPNGVCIISTPNGPKQSYNENPYHYKEYSSKEISHLASRYFKMHKVYGVFGDGIVSKYENLRKRRIIKFFAYDPMKLRKLIPIRIKQILFDLTSYINRKSMMNSGIANISIKNYTVKKVGKNAIDLILVAKSPLSYKKT